MRETTTIYELRPVTDDPRYEGFAFTRDASLRGKATLTHDFLPDNIPIKGRNWTVTRLVPYWRPQKVEGRVQSYNDYPCVNLAVPAFSKRAVQTLMDLLEPNGELLPLITTLGEYYAYNACTVADVLDRDRSVIVWLDEDKVIADTVQRFECKPSRLRGLTIFRIVEEPASVFVTNVFVERVKRNWLNGFYFVKVWPFPKNTSWQEQEREQRRQALQIHTRRGRSKLKGNTVVICLSLADPKPSKTESNRLAIISDQLDGLLAVHRPNDPYFGSLEGNDSVEGQFRLFLSCPNADHLFEKLRPWLTNLDWKGEVRVIKRYGEFLDPNAPEQIAEL